MRQFSTHSRQPRRGQALLLAVLIMIFAALLSASFIAVVSVNLNQTARQTDKNRAVESAKAGVDYINRQLAFSPEGERWRPPAPPASTDLAYPFYYSAMDRIQGWAGEYSKFPDPRDEQGVNNGPQFLAKVERIAYNTLSTSSEIDKAGSLKITVIGLSPEDPTAFSRTVFYKGGYQNAPIAQNMRVVSNWDFKNSVVPVAQASSATATPYNPLTRVVTLTNIKGDFPEPPFAVMIGDPRTITATPSKTTRGAVVVAKTATTFTFAHPGATTPDQALNVDAGERIELAASLGAPNGLDYNNTGPSANPTPIATPVAIADNTTPGGIRVNGGLWLTGKATSFSLRAPVDAYGPGINVPATIQASGMFGREISTAPGTGVTNFQVQGVGITGTPDLLSSHTPTFPGGWALPTTPRVYDRRSRYQLVSDGWNRLYGVPSGSARSGTTANPDLTGIRATDNFVPPAIDRGEGLERYRNLTRFSPPATGTNPAVSLYGGGQGIYIDNAQDKERIYVTNEDINGNTVLDAGEDVNNDGFLETTTGLREMRPNELVNMWLSRPIPSTATPTNYMRNGAPLPLNSATASLEQQRVRGWVGPDEFRARGVEIELVAGNPPTLAITRDARDDGLSNVFGGADAKAWKNPVTGAIQPGVYRRNFAWPQNGVIFAEGNIRIKGSVTNAPRSLTVVSMGNIYIEDSLSAAPRKVLLLATKNVVMNPTRVLGRPDAQTKIKAGANFTVTTPATLVTVQVEDAADFQVGDLVRASRVALGAENVDAQGFVTARNLTPNNVNDTLTISPTKAGTVNANSLLRTPTATPQVTNTVPFGAIASSDDAMQRRFNTPTALTAANPLRLAFNHGGDRPTTNVFSVGTTTPPPTGTVLFSHKRVLNVGIFNPNAPTVSNTNKLIRVDFNTPPNTGRDTFPTPAMSRTLLEIETSMDAAIHGATGSPNNWRYSTTLNPAYSAVPFFYLAGIGNRFDYGVDPATVERRENVNSATEKQIPLATSIGLWLNGLPRSSANPITSEFWNGTTYSTTTQFGFNPTYFDVGATPPTLPEDILTGDRGFYQNDASRSTLDSRALGATVAGSNTLVFRQSDGLVGINPAAPLPAYRMRGLKAENVVLNASTLNSINPGYTFTVGAYVYAQTGSWFVIPSGLFNDRLKTIPDPNNAAQTITFLDINNNGTATDPVTDVGEYIPAGASGNSFSNGYPDLNRNGIIEDIERYAMERYSRYNYQINFIGAISEGQTPIVNTMRSGANLTDPIVANGAVESWMLSSSTVQKTSAAAPSTNGRMTYTFDSDVVRGLLEDDPATTAIDPDSGFHLPQTTSIFNVS